MIEILLNYIRPAVRDQRGQTFVEYTLIGAGVSIALVLVFQPLGVSLNAFINVLEDAF